MGIFLNNEHCTVPLGRRDRAGQTGSECLDPNGSQLVNTCQLQSQVFSPCPLSRPQTRPSPMTAAAVGCPVEALSLRIIRSSDDAPAGETCQAGEVPPWPSSLHLPVNIALVNTNCTDAPFIGTVHHLIGWPAASSWQQLSSAASQHATPQPPGEAAFRRHPQPHSAQESKGEGIG